VNCLKWSWYVVRNSIVSPELGTQANPIVIGDDPASLGAVSNPIMIYVNEGWCYDETGQLVFDAHTDIMATPNSGRI
jgi:arginase family enzyme